MFRLRSIFKVDINVSLSKIKAISTNSRSCLDVTMHNNGIVVLGIQRPPVNSLNLELFQQMMNSLNELENDQCKGIILSSNLPQVFSAGIDLMELIKPAPDRLHTFINVLHEVCIKLYGLDAVTTVAINGTTAAAGCVLSTLLDYRVMVNGKSTIGLNDSELGIVPLKWIHEAMCEIIGRKQAILALTASTKFTPEEALKVGLVDELAVDNCDAIEKCKQFIGRFDKIPPLTRSAIKHNMRQTLLNDMRENKDEYIKTMVNSILDPKTQNSIEIFVNNLNSRNKTVNR